MSVLDIVQIGHPVLRSPTEVLTQESLASAEVQSFIDDLIETMRHANGAGLAANQVGRSLKICAIEVGDNPRYPYKPKIPLRVLVNPVLRPITEEVFLNNEGCLSVPNLRGEVERFVGIELSALNRDGSEIREEVWGLSAGTYQHECDHLDGKLFTDRVKDFRSFSTWKNFEEYQRDAFIARVETLVARFKS